MTIVRLTRVDDTGLPMPSEPCCLSIEGAIVVSWVRPLLSYIEKRSAVWLASTMLSGLARWPVVSSVVRYPSIEPHRAEGTGLQYVSNLNAAF